MNVRYGEKELTYLRQRKGKSVVQKTARSIPGAKQSENAEAMEYTCTCASPLGEICLASDGTALTGIWLEGQKHYARTLSKQHQSAALPVFEETGRWLDVYFSGREPDFLPQLAPKGTAFQQAVWDILLNIPYGETRTYGAIADMLAAQMGLARMSAQAVGAAVGHNPISILVPCHRVIGAYGNLTGYAGGLDRKCALLKLEHHDLSAFTMPKKQSEDSRACSR